MKRRSRRCPSPPWKEVHLTTWCLFDEANCWKPSTWTRCCWGCRGGPSSLVLAFPAAKHILDITTNPNITRLSFKCRLGKVPKKKNTIIFFWKWTIDAWNKFYTWSHLNIFIIASVISVYICPKWAKIWYQRGTQTNTLHYIKSFCNGIGG